jgi:membrane protein
VSTGASLRSAGTEARRLLLGVFGRIGECGLTDRAAALTYYGFLSLFPGLIVLVALLGLLGSYPETYRDIISTLREAAPGGAVDTIDSALRDVLRNRGTASSLLGIGLLISAYSASSAMGAALRAVQTINGTAGTISWWREIAARLILTLAVVALLIVAFSALLVAGPFLSSLAEAAGVSESTRSLLSLIRWPLGLLSLVAGALLIYRAGTGRAPLRELLPGAITSTILWAIASLGFDIYVAHFSSYDATYGSLGAVIVLLVWMWIGSLSLLAGAALNAELAGRNPPAREVEHE